MDPIEAKRRKMEERLRKKRARQESERVPAVAAEELEADEDLEVLAEVDPLPVPDDDDDLGLDEDVVDLDDDDVVDLDDDDLDDADDDELDDADDDELDDLEDALVEDDALEADAALEASAPLTDLDPSELALPPDDDDLGLDDAGPVDLDGDGRTTTPSASCERCAETQLRLDAVRSLVRGLQQVLADDRGDPGSILAEVAVSLGSLLDAREP